MIGNLIPKSHEAREMMDIVRATMNVKNILAIENDHCAESYGCLIISEKERGDEDGFGRIFYSGDTSPCQKILNYA